MPFTNFTFGGSTDKPTFGGRGSWVAEGWAAVGSRLPSTVCGQRSDTGIGGYGGGVCAIAAGNRCSCL